MTIRIYVRWGAVLLVTFVALVSVSLVVNRSLLVRARPLATDYTVGGPCGATIQTCIDNSIVLAGDRILIPTGTYTESVTLNKPVSLIGADAETTIIQAVANQRVMTVTGPTIANSVVISNLTITGGRLDGCYIGPVDCVAGILITNTANPLLANLIITGNFSSWGASGLYAEPGGVLTLIDVSFLSNSTYPAPGPSAYISGSVEMIRGRFADNVGGGLAVQGMLALTGTEFVNNEASSGAGAWVTGVAELSGSRFERNHSTSRSSSWSGGGGLFVSGVLTINHAEFVSNTSDSYGGSLTFAGGTGMIRDTVFMGNSANYYGGGVIAGVGGDLFIYDTQFLSNTSVAGGGLYANRPLTIANGYFENNVSQAGIGGGYGSCGGLLAGDSINISDSYFIGNSAAHNGGAICHFDRTPNWPAGNGYIANTVFARNKAVNEGAALYLDSASSDVILHSAIGDTELNPKSAIVVLTGTVGITDTIIASHTVAISQTEGTVYQDYNLFFGNTSDLAGAISGGTHNVTGDPLFVNTAADNYHITSSSAAKDAGVNAGVYTDMDDQPRPYNLFDIGVDEYWAPGALKQVYLPLVVKSH